MAFDVKAILLGSGPITQIGDLILDACVYRNMTFDAEITEHAVEEGANIADHHAPLPDVIMIEGRITNSPITQSYPGATTVNAITALAKGNANFVIDAQDLLIKYRNTSERLIVKTSRKIFDDMLITSLVFDEDSTTKNKLVFTATLKRVKIVQTGFASLLALGKDKSKKVKEKDGNGEESKNKQSKPKKEAGKQSTAEASKSEDTKGKSFLASIVDM